MKALIVSLVAYSCFLINHANADVTQEEFEEIHGNGFYTWSQKNDAKKKADKAAKEIEKGKLKTLAKKTDVALNAMMNIGVRNLERYGHHAEAQYIRDGWRRHIGTLERIVSNDGRKIGDYKPLSTFIALAYELLELKLGYDKCWLLRLTDIKSLNFGIPVVFDPCTYGLEEFELHLYKDERYRGLVEVVTYWGVLIGCNIATFGAGTFFICSPIAMLSETVMGSAIAPWLAPKIYGMVCN